MLSKCRKSDKKKEGTIKTVYVWATKYANDCNISIYVYREISFENMLKANEGSTDKLSNRPVSSTFQGLELLLYDRSYELNRELFYRPEILV